MGEFDVRGSELKKLIKLAKKQPLAFAYSPGSGPKDDYFGMDRRKPANVVGKKAREEGPSKKVAFGMASVEGKVLSLACEKELPAMAKKVKKYLKFEKVTLNVQILGPDGSLLESDIEDDLPDDPDMADDTDGAPAPGSSTSDEAQETAQAPDETESVGSEQSDEVNPGEIRDKLKALGAQIQELGSPGSALMKPYKQLVDFLKAGDLARASAGIDKVTQAVEKLAKAAASTVSSSSEDSTDTGTAPDTAPWDKLREEVEALLKQTVEAVPSAAGKLEAAWEQVVSLADAEQIDKAVARAKKLIPTLQRLLDSTVSSESSGGDAPEKGAPPSDETGGDDSGDGDRSEFDKVKQALEKRLAALSAGLDVAKRVLEDKASEIGQNIEKITGLEFPGDLNIAKKAADALDRFVETAAERARRADTAQDEVTRVRGYIKTMDQDATDRLGSAPPKDLADLLEKAETGLASDDETDPDAIEASVEAAMTLLEQFEKALTALLADKATWDSQLGLFEPRLTALKNHAQKDADPVKKRIAALDTALVEIKKKAAAHAYADATKDLIDLAKTCDEAEDYADDCAHFKNILEDRRKRVNDLTTAYSPTGATVHDLIKTAVTKVKTDFEKAENHGAGDTPDYQAGLAILQPLAKQIDDVEWRGKRSDQYASARQNVKDLIDWYAKQPEVDDVDKLLAPMRDLYNQSDVATTNSFAKSLTLVDRAQNIGNTIFKTVKLNTDFKASHKSADTKIKALKAHDGKDGIAGHITGLEGDLARSEAKRDLMEFLLAKNICDQIVKDADEAEKLAVDYKTYLNAKKTLKTEKDGWEKKWLNFVKELVDQVTRLEGEATSAVGDENYKLAEKLIQEAIYYAKDAGTQITVQKQATEDFKDAKSDIASASGDMAAEIATVEGLKTKAEGADTKGTYADEIAKGQGFIQAAQTKLAAKPADEAGAKADLEKACDRLHYAFFEAQRRSIYEDIRSSVKTEYDGLVATNRGDALKTDTDKIDAAFKAAEEAADKKDNVTAENEIGKVVALLKPLKEKADAYDKHKTLLEGDIAALDTWFDTAVGTFGKPKDELDTEFADYGKKKTDAGTEASSKEWKKALEKLEKAKEAGDLYKLMFADFQRAKNVRKSRITDFLGTLHTDPEAVELYNPIKPKIEKVDKLIDERQYDQAIALATTTQLDIALARDAQSRAAEVKPKRDAAAQAIKTMKDEACPPIQPDIDKAEKLLAEVDADIKQKVYPNALKTVDTIPPLCVKPTEIGKEYKLYAPVKAEAQAAIEGLRKDHGKDDAVRLQLERLDARMIGLAPLEAKRDFPAAKAAAKGISDAAKAVAAEAGTQAKLDQAADMLADVAPTETAGFDKQLGAIRAGLEKLRGLKGSDSRLVKEHADRIGKLLDEAETEFNDAGDIVSARDKLARAAEGLARANTVLRQFTQMDDEISTATKRHADMKALHKEPSKLAGLFDAAHRMILAATGSVEQGLFDQAMNELNDARKSLDEAQAIGTAHSEYATERGKLAPRLADLNKHKARYAVADEIDEARLYMVAAAEKAEALNPKEALDDLKKCTSLVAQAEIKADMHANEEPDEAKLKALLEAPGGPEQMDEIFKTLDPAVQRKACKKALEMRFGIDLRQTVDKAGTVPDTATDVPAPNVTRLFGVMAGLDDEHTTDNPSVGLVQRFGSESGTSSFGWNWDSGSGRVKKNIKLRVGRAEMPEETVIGQEWEIGKIDDNCKPVDDAPAQKFSWTTLHEIGHAVDDKYAVMDRNGKSAKYGGWKEYGGDVSDIADAAAGQFDYPAAYIASYLSNPSGNFPKPEPKNNVAAEEWDQRRLAAEAWCDSIRHGNSIWYSASETNRLKIGGRVYQEAYAGKWVSYDFAARSQGVRGYQFRAPGEWFADIYAAFHSGKMNPKHPAREWLEKDMSN